MAAEILKRSVNIAVTIKCDCGKVHEFLMDDTVSENQETVIGVNDGAREIPQSKACQGTQQAEGADSGGLAAIVPSPEDSSSGTSSGTGVPQLQGTQTQSSENKSETVEQVSIPTDGTCSEGNGTGSQDSDSSTGASLATESSEEIRGLPGQREAGTIGPDNIYSGPVDLPSPPAGNGDDKVADVSSNVSTGNKSATIIVNDKDLPSQVFPADSYWSVPIIDEPADPAMASAVGVMHFYQGAVEGQRWICYDFGMEGGLPYVTVENYEHDDIAIIPADGVKPGESVPYIKAPLPDNTPLEGGAGLRAIVLDKSNHMLYEYTGVKFRPDVTAISGPDTISKACSSVNIWDVTGSDEQEPIFEFLKHTSLPILPGLVKPWELIDHEGNGKSAGHALRILSPVLRPSVYYLPAPRGTNFDGTRPNNHLFPILGSKIRLKKTFDTSSYPPYAKGILETLKEYGGVIVGKGTMPLTVTGICSSEFTQEIHSQLDSLASLNGVAFLQNLEFVKLDPKRLVTF